MQEQKDTIRMQEEKNIQVIQEQKKIQPGNKTFKIVAVSDTHGYNQQMQKLIENNESGDIFIHAGDFTRYGRQQHFESFVSILKNLNFKYKIVVAGNHQVSLDENMPPHYRQKKLQKYPCKYSRDQLLKMLQQNCIYLEHQIVEIQGIKIFGSPYSQKYGKAAFQYDHSYENILWGQIPQVDILITHCPPYKILDKADSGKHGGSQALRKKVFEIKPKLHLFGHIHQGKGNITHEGIKFYNLAKNVTKILQKF